MPGNYRKDTSMEEDKITERANAARNLIEQTRNAPAAYAAGAIDRETYIEQRAVNIASLRALARCEGGEEITDEEFAAMIDNAKAEAAMPTQEEINAANIDYLLMIGGEL